jgi:succinyl-diaminopimelate desuccinylase
MLNPFDQRVCKRISSLEGEVVSLAKELISVPTADPPGENYDECAKVIADYLKTVGAQVEILQVPLESLSLNPQTGEPMSRPNVVAEIKGAKKGPVLHYNGHYDVVPASEDWTLDPYKPMVKEGKLYGRGSVDMKGAIAAMLLAAKVLICEGAPLGGTLSFSFVPEEENDGAAGTKFLLEEKGLKADYCIVGEPSGRMSLFNGHRGCLWLEIRTLGKAAHGSAPWVGINAFEKMVHVVNAIEREIKPKLTIREGSRDKPGSITLGGKVVTGDVPNTVPQSCTMTIDRRLIPGEELEKVLSDFSTVLKQLEKEDPDLRAEMKVLSGYDPCATPLASDLVTTVNDVLRTVSGESPQVSLMMAGCDMRYFHQRGIATLIYGPGELSMAHQSDEHVEIDALMTAAKVYALSAMRLLRPD